MRPTHIDDIIGQSHLVDDGKIIRRMVDAKSVFSMILFGPPGTGKTSLAFAIAQSLDLPVRKLNAVTDRKKDMEIVVEEAKMTGRIVLILDEVHRLDKAKQDFLRSEEHTSELQSRGHLVCRLLLEKKKRDREQALERMQ